MIILVVSLAFSTIWSGVSTSAGVKRPNIVVVVADDLGWNDVSFHGSPQIPTPNIDALAADGLVLDNYYVQPLCTPSRAALMSGYYPIHMGLQTSVGLGSSNKSLPLKLTILPQYLKRLGYSTHAVGKWHLGHHKKEFTPTYRGFDSFFGSYLGYGDYYDHTTAEGSFWGFDLHDNMEPAWNESGQYATELFTRKAVNVIKKHDTSNPLFLYLAHKAVHFGNFYGRLSAPVKYTKELPHIRSINRRLFAGMVTAMDESVGEIFEALQEKEMLRNTIVLFTSDNGGDVSGIQKGTLQNVSSNWPLRGGKMTLWQGGVRGVGILWSGLTIPGRTVQKQMAVRRQLLHISDWLPTLYQAAGGNIQDLGSIDGVNMWESLIKNQPSPRREILLNIDPQFGDSGLLARNYKLLNLNFSKTMKWFKPSGRDTLSMANLQRLPLLVSQSAVSKALKTIGRYFSVSTLDFYTRLNVTCGPRPSYVPEESLCLFDLTKDPCEYNNIARENPEIVRLMSERLNEFNRTIVTLKETSNFIWSDPDLHGFLWTSWADSHAMSS